MKSMKEWLNSLPTCGKPFPILSFPCVSLLGITVNELTHSADLQAKGMKAVADRIDAAASVSMMDLSVEAEAFGCTVQTSENEVPTVIGALLEDEDDADALEIPKVGAARTGIYVEAAAKAKQLITDRPVLAGMIGPFTLCGRLMTVSEALCNCIADPDLVHIVMKKTTAFLIDYANAYKAAGVDGIVLAEPLSGLLSPEQEAEFSAPYVKELVAAVQDDGFLVIYHNCGPNTPLMTESLASIGAAAYHFGDAVKMKDLLDKMPADVPVCGNISPAEQFLKGSPESMTDAVRNLLAECGSYPNFVLSSGCDIPPASPWTQIEAFMAAGTDR